MTDRTKTSAAAVRIEAFRPEWRRQFYDLNTAWLREHFEIEPIDERILANPEREIIDPGGAVYFALLGDEVVGTCALKHDGLGSYELTKMAVAPEHRGLGIGQMLVEAAVTEFAARHGRELFLESSSKLRPALRLYERTGFVRQTTAKPGSEYARADVYMIYAPSAGRRRE